MIILTLPNELIFEIFKYLQYIDVKNLALTNKKLYQIYLELKKKEKCYYINQKLDFQKLNFYVSQGFRYIQVKENIEKIINISYHSNKKQISVFFTSGRHIFINMDYFEVKTITINYHVSGKNFYLDKVKLIIESPFIIKCKIIDGINKKLKKIIKQE